MIELNGVEYEVLMYVEFKPKIHLKHNELAKMFMGAIITKMLIDMLRERDKNDLL